MGGAPCARQPDLAFSDRDQRNAHLADFGRLRQARRGGDPTDRASGGRRQLGSLHCAAATGLVRARAGGQPASRSHRITSCRLADVPHRCRPHPAGWLEPDAGGGGQWLPAHWTGKRGRGRCADRQLCGRDRDDGSWRWTLEPRCGAGGRIRDAVRRRLGGRSCVVWAGQPDAADSDSR